MRLFPSDEAFRLYETGFGTDDSFKRQGTGKALSELVEKIDDPLVVAIDGDWGSGKTWFLKRWVGAHSLENGGTAITIYFDAFAHDYLDDPLIALIGEVERRFPAERQSKFVAVKDAAFRISKPAFRIGLSLLSAGLTELASTILDAGIDSAKGELMESSDRFWQKESDRAAAMASFKKALRQLTILEEDKSQKIVIIIDELDRCRPDYALSLLEVIKHFFSVDHVHFVLGTHMKALENSVKARYGAEIDAFGYLKRFISLSLNLSDSIDDYNPRPAVCEFAKQRALEAGLGKNTCDELYDQLRLVNDATKLSFRDCESIVMRLILVPSSKKLDEFTPGYRIIILSLLTIRILAPSLYSRLCARKATIEEVTRFYGITNKNTNEIDRPRYNHTAFYLKTSWQYVIDGSTLDDIDKRSVSRAFGSFGMESQEGFVKKIDKDFISVFQL